MQQWIFKYVPFNYLEQAKIISDPLIKLFNYFGKQNMYNYF